MKEESLLKLKSVNERLTTVLKDVQSMKEENTYLRQALTQGRKDLDNEREKSQDLQAELEAMKLAQVITGDAPVDKQARSRINEMVKEIDRCIALMNN